MRNNFKGKESKRKKAKNNNCVETRFDKKELMKIKKNTATENQAKNIK